jgi:hypothetical protein
VLEVLEVLERHGFRTGTVLPSSPSLTPFRPSAASELIGKVGWNRADGEKRYFSGDRNSESAPGILQPPARRGLGLASRPDPCHRLNLRPRRSRELSGAPLLEIGAEPLGRLWVRQKIQCTREGGPKQGADGPSFPKKAMRLVIRAEYTEIKRQNA